MKIIEKLTFVVISFFLFSCSHTSKTELYYINSQNLSSKNSIKFYCKENNDYQKWEISSNETNTLIKVKRYDSKNKLIDETLEKITQNGSDLISYTFVNYSQEFPKTILFYPKQKELIKWDLNEESVYTGEFIYDGIIFNIKRSRKFLEKHKDTLIFIDKFSMEPMIEVTNNSIGCVFKSTIFDKIEYKTSYQSFTQKSYFKKKIGIVKYERLYPNGEKKTFQISS